MNRVQRESLHHSETESSKINMISKWHRWLLLTVTDNNKHLMPNCCGGPALWTVARLYLCWMCLKCNKNVEIKTCGSVKLRKKAVAKLTHCTGSGEQCWEVFSGIARKGLNISFGLCCLKMKEKIKLSMKKQIWPNYNANQSNSSYCIYSMQTFLVMDMD